MLAFLRLILRIAPCLLTGSLRWSAVAERKQERAQKNAKVARRGQPHSGQRFATCPKNIEKVCEIGCNFGPRFETQFWLQFWRPFFQIILIGPKTGAKTGPKTGSQTWAQNCNQFRKLFQYFRACSKSLPAMGLPTSCNFRIFLRASLLAFCDG